jgi:hypothetical protein
MKCPSCDVDITAMDLAAFRDHTREKHPDVHHLILRALERVSGRLPQNGES